MQYKKTGRRNGNVGNIKKYYTSLDLLKFDQVITQKSNKGVFPSDMDFFLEHNAFFCFGEVKHEGVWHGRKFEIMRDALVEFHSGFGFFAESLPDKGLRSLRFTCQFVDASISHRIGWQSHEMYIALSVYSQLMWLFANTYMYKTRPQISLYEGDQDELFKETNNLFIGLVMEIVDANECGTHLCLPEYMSDLCGKDKEEYAPIKGTLEELFLNFDKCLPS